jgi:hypothetical protein
MSPAEPPNPVTAGHANPQWAQLTRLAGDRAAILFDELRRRVGAIEGLIEELVIPDKPQTLGNRSVLRGVEEFWIARYRLGDSPRRLLFTAHILPAALEATLTLDTAQRDRLLSSRKLGSAMKQLIRQAPVVDGRVSVHVRLNNRTAVRAFSTLIAMKSKLIDLYP